MKYSHINHTALASQLEKAGTAIISPDYANVKGFEARYIGVKINGNSFLYQFEDMGNAIWDCYASEIDEIRGLNLQNEIFLPDEIIILLKANAVGTYTSNGENANDYDAIMAANSFDDIPEIELWGPLEGQPLVAIKEYIESEFTSLCLVVRESIEIYNRG